MRSRINAIVLASLYAGMIIDNLLMVAPSLCPVTGSWLLVCFPSLTTGEAWSILICSGKMAIHYFLSVHGIDIVPVGSNALPDSLFKNYSYKRKPDKHTIKHQVFPPRQQRDD